MAILLRLALNSSARRPRSSSAPKSTSSRSRSIPSRPTLIGDLPFLQAAWQGQLDGALLQLERAFMPAYGDTSPGTVVLFAGRISDVDCSRTGIDMKCRSHLELLNIQMPRRLWQSSCTHIFGDAMCQFDRSSMQATFAAGPGSTQAQIGPQSRPTPTKLFAQGTISASRGQCRVSRTIASFAWQHGLVKLPFLSPIPLATNFSCCPAATARSQPVQTSSITPSTSAAFPTSRRRRRRYEPKRQRVHRRGCKPGCAHPIIIWARVKGGGTDCLMLLAEVYEKAGVIPHVDVPFYPPDWNLHRDAERYLEGIMRYAARE